MMFIERILENNIQLTKIMTENAKERILAGIQTDESRVYAARKLAKWFSIYFRIQIFGQTIIEKTWPDDSSSPEKGGGE